MTPDNARKRARQLWLEANKSMPIYDRQTWMLRTLVKEGCDPVYAATAAGFAASVSLPPWLADMAHSDAVAAE